MTPDRRQESRHRWAGSAPGWDARAEMLRRATMPVSAWMVDAIEPQAGHVVLELAAGPGDTGFLAAELIQPGGTLISSDFSPEMLSVAQRRASEQGIANVRFRQIDPETSIDIEAASVDGVLSRWGYMLMQDHGTALRETRRVLKPGGRVALAAWTTPDDNRWSSLGFREMVRHGLIEPDPPDAPGQYAWAREGRIAEELEAAGFVEPQVETVEFTMRYPTFEDWWEAQQDMGLRFRQAVGAAGPAGREEVRETLRAAAEPYAAPDGSLAFPARTWVAAASA
jgi:SAM-dependent methyltransferase